MLYANDKEHFNQRLNDLCEHIADRVDDVHVGLTDRVDELRDRVMWSKRAIFGLVVLVLGGEAAIIKLLA